MMDWLERPGTRLGWRLLMVAGLASLAMATGCGDDGSAAGDDDDDSVDGGMVDAGPEVDGGEEPTACVVGNTCQDVGDCPGVGTDRTAACLAEVQSELGITIDPVRGLDEPVPVTEWAGGYCTAEGAPGVGCATDADCGAGLDGRSCGRCVPATAINGDPIRRCLQRCNPTSNDNGSCRDGYQCDWITSTCIPGCSNATECQVYREDTNGNGVLDPFNPIVNREGDQLVLDPNAVGATCNGDTFRCDQPGNPAASAGDPCDRDSQCMENGECLGQIETDGVFVGGYCTRFGCRDASRACDGEEEICMAKDIGSDACLARCTVGEEADNPLLRIGVDGRALDCRRNYRCAWDGVSLDGTGGCLPGNYNPISDEMENLGGTCGFTAPSPIGLDDSQCWSPFGAGVCIGRAFGAMDPGNDEVVRQAWTSCVLRDCFAPGISATCTANGGSCIELADRGAGEPSNSLCVPRCSAAEDCPGIGGLACNETFLEGTGVCVPNCLDQRGRPDDRRCASGLVCNRNLGLCVAP